MRPSRQRVPTTSAAAIVTARPSLSAATATASYAACDGGVGGATQLPASSTHNSTVLFCRVAFRPNQSPALNW
jgi:hypothetical protein